MAVPTTKPARPKQIVYLWGAGATQAEIDYVGASSVNLLMRDNALGEGVATRILRRLPERSRTAFSSDRGTDIEKLISLLVASNVAKHARLADKIRRLYFEDICSTLATTKTLDNPELAIGLFEMHKSQQFHEQVETLSGIITTNHDGLLQVAAQRAHGDADIGVRFESDDLTPATSPRPLVLQLHGSFTWRFGLPLRVSFLRKASAYSPDTVWIPPTILKESKSYPFNKLAGQAYELLSKQCDVLRVVGSALAQNDWHVLSMLFSAQRHRELTRGTAFRIELITQHDVGSLISQECSYLKNLTPIGHLTDGGFADYKEPEATHSAEMGNALAYWLKEKVRFHLGRGDFGGLPLAPSLVRIIGDAS